MHALIFTAVYSRHLFVHLSFRQDLPAAIAGFDAAWAFFGGVVKVVIPDNMPLIVDQARLTEPRLRRKCSRPRRRRGWRPPRCFTTATAKVHRDHHVEAARAQDSVPGSLIGARLDVRADSRLVRIWHHGQLVKTHPRQRPVRRPGGSARAPERLCDA